MNRGHEDWIEVTSFQWSVDGENDTLVLEQSGPKESSRLYVGETAAINYSKCEFEYQLAEDVGAINFAKIDYDLG
jgi:hypothetical protein